MCADVISRFHCVNSCMVNGASIGCNVTEIADDAPCSEINSVNSLNLCQIVFYCQYMSLSSVISGHIENKMYCYKCYNAFVESQL